jgi:anti-sigma B factor antagonist
MAAVSDLDSGSTLDIRAVVHPGRHTLVLGGELDITSAPELQYFVARLCAEGARKIVLDLMGLSFMDSTGLQAILASQSVCEEHGAILVLTPAHGGVQRVFEITGMIDTLPFARVAI